MAKKYYAVAEGRTPGIFTDWASAEKEVKGFAGARFKSFSTEIEAQAWIENPVYNKSGGKKSRRKPIPKNQKPIPEHAIVVYTDGGSINNPGPGGYGVVIDIDGVRRELSGGYRCTTNNRMEMMGAIVALEDLSGIERPICLHSDSSYMVNGVTKGWAEGWRRRGWKKSDGSPALNVDLWEKLLNLIQGRVVEFRWVKGHAGDPMNERCDTLAVAAARKNPKDVDHGYEMREPT